LILLPFFSHNITFSCVIVFVSKSFHIVVLWSIKRLNPRSSKCDVNNYKRSVTAIMLPTGSLTPLFLFLIHNTSVLKAALARGVATGALVKVKA
jgi:hypothetical protein